MIPKHWIAKDRLMPTQPDPLAYDAEGFARQYFHGQGGSVLTLYKDQAWVIAGGRKSIRSDFQTYFSDAQVASPDGLVVSVWWVQRMIGHKMRHMISIGSAAIQDARSAYHRFHTRLTPVAQIQFYVDYMFRFELSGGKRR